MSEELKLGEWYLGKFLETLLARFFPRIKRKLGLQASLSNFALQIIDEEHATTTRQSTGQAGRDFQFYPVISVTPDVNGTIEVDWMWKNFFDGAPAGSSTHTVGVEPAIGDIINTFPNLVGGRAVDLQLVDNRDPATTGRDPTKNGSIAIGDDAFIALGKQDGAWHSFESDVAITVKSPSGASVTISGKLGPENFKSVGGLSASMRPFAVNVIV
jgi:hypothetical protein